MPPTDGAGAECLRLRRRAGCSARRWVGRRPSDRDLRPQLDGKDTILPPPYVLSLRRLAQRGTVVCARCMCEGKRVIYVDTTNAFTAQRVADFAQGETQRLHLIDVFRLHDVYALHQLLDQLTLRIDDPSRSRPVVFIVDSISALLTTVSNFDSRQSMALIECLGRALRRLADDHDIAVMVTNHEVGRGTPRTHSQRAPENGAPALGHVWRHQVHRRVHVQTRSQNWQSIECESSLSYIRLDKDTIMTVNESSA